MNKDMENVLEGCNLLMETVEAQKETIGGLLGAVQDLEKILGNLIAICSNQSESIESLSTRIDIVNKRLRRIENVKEALHMTRFISAGQLAERYEVNKATIWRWVQRGILPQPIKLSEQCTRFSLEEIERREAEHYREVCLK